MVWFIVGRFPKILQKTRKSANFQAKVCLDGVKITFMWFTVQEREVINGDVPCKIIPDCTFNQNLPKRNKSTTLQFPDMDF